MIGIGETLAQFELRLGLSLLATHGQFSFADNKQVTAQRRGLILSINNGIRMQRDR